MSHCADSSDKRFNNAEGMENFELSVDEENMCEERFVSCEAHLHWPR